MSKPKIGIAMNIRLPESATDALLDIEESTGATKTRIMSASFLGFCAMPEDRRAELITQAVRVQKGRDNWSSALLAMRAAPPNQNHDHDDQEETA